MPIFAAGVGARLSAKLRFACRRQRKLRLRERRVAMRDIGSDARRPPAAKIGIPPGCTLLARSLSPELRSGWRQAKRSFAESRVAEPCRWIRSFAESPAPNRASTACNAALLPVRNPG